MTTSPHTAPVVAALHLTAAKVAIRGLRVDREEP